MGWIAITSQSKSHFWPQGLGARPNAAPCIDTGPDALLPRGSLVIETRLPTLNRPQALLIYDRCGKIPLHLSLQALPGGGLAFVIDQDGEMQHGSINAAETGRADIVRVTYSWDAPARWGRLSLERPDEHVVHMLDVDAPKPLPIADIKAFAGGQGQCQIAPEVVYVAVSTQIEPVGPLPSIVPGTPIATPSGYRPIEQIRKGDLVRSACGRDVPVLAQISRKVPAIGSHCPVWLRAPSYGLKHDICIASFQRLALSGSLVDYMFGTETVLAPAAHLSSNRYRDIDADDGPFLVQYAQLVLPRNESLVCAGAFLESLNIGRMRRKPRRLLASALSEFDRNALPEHACPKHRILQPFEAAVLAETRAA